MYCHHNITYKLIDRIGNIVMYYYNCVLYNYNMGMRSHTYNHQIQIMTYSTRVNYTVTEMSTLYMLNTVSIQVDILL